MVVMTKEDSRRCPRCNHWIPNDDTPGKYPGAISRYDNITEICSVCGLDEAVPGGNGVLSPEKWPITWTLGTMNIWMKSREVADENDNG